MINRNFLRYRKGTVIDILPILFFILLLGMLALIGSRILTDITPQLNTTLTSNVSINIINEANSDYSIIFDTVIPLFFVGLMLGMIVSAFLIKTQPLFFMVTVLLLVLLVLIVPVVSNIYMELCDSLPVQCAEYNRTQWIFDRLPLLLTFAGFITAIVLYAVFKR